MPENRDRLQTRLADIEQALKEARSADVRELLDDLLDACRKDIDRLGAPGSNPAGAGVTEASRAG